ncbi:hypothetical protein T4B_15078, partial [Trichinella pseudospiralis]
LYFSFQQLIIFISLRKHARWFSVPKVWYCMNSIVVLTFLDLIICWTSAYFKSNIFVSSYCQLNDCVDEYYIHATLIFYIIIFIATTLIHLSSLILLNVKKEEEYPLQAIKLKKERKIAKRATLCLLLIFLVYVAPIVCFKQFMRGQKVSHYHILIIMHRYIDLPFYISCFGLIHPDIRECLKSNKLLKPIFFLWKHMKCRQKTAAVYTGPC